MFCWFVSMWRREDLQPEHWRCFYTKCIKEKKCFILYRSFFCPKKSLFCNFRLNSTKNKTCWKSNDGGASEDAGVILGDDGLVLRWWRWNVSGEEHHGPAYSCVMFGLTLMYMWKLNWKETNKQEWSASDKKKKDLKVIINHVCISTCYQKGKIPKHCVEILRFSREYVSLCDKM